MRTDSVADRRRRGGRGARGGQPALRRRVRAGAPERLPHADARRPGSARGDPALQLRADAGVALGAISSRTSCGCTTSSGSARSPRRWHRPCSTSVGVDVSADRYTLHAGGAKANLRRLPGPVRRGQGRRGGRAPTILPDLQDGEALDLIGLSSRAALHPAAAALHGGHADQGAGGARHRAAVHLRAHHRDDPAARLREHQGPPPVPGGIGLPRDRPAGGALPGHRRPRTSPPAWKTSSTRSPAASASGCPWSATSGCRSTPRSPRVARRSPSRSR